MRILVCEGNMKTAKSYPFWEQLYPLLEHHEVKKIEGILSEPEIIELLNWCDVWVSIDSFLQHLVAWKGIKRGVVLWGISNPDMFGYPNNVNLLKDRKYLRPDQFIWWKDEKLNPDAFVDPKMVVLAIESVVQ